MSDFFSGFLSHLVENNSYCPANNTPDTQGIDQSSLMLLAYGSLMTGAVVAGALTFKYTHLCQKKSPIHKLNNTKFDLITPEPTLLLETNPVAEDHSNLDPTDNLIEMNAAGEDKINAAAVDTLVETNSPAEGEFNAAPIDNSIEINATSEDKLNAVPVDNTELTEKPAGRIKKETVQEINTAPSIGERIRSGALKRDCRK